MCVWVCVLEIAFVYVLPSIHVQWNSSIEATFGEQSFDPYTEVAFVEGLFCAQTVHLGTGFLAIITEVAVKRGSTVLYSTAD